MTMLTMMMMIMNYDDDGNMRDDIDGDDDETMIAF